MKKMLFNYSKDMKVTLTSLRRLQKDGWKVCKNICVGTQYNVFSRSHQPPQINKVSKFVRRLKGIRSFKMEEICFQPDYGQTTLLSKRMATNRLKKLKILIVRNYLKHYMNFRRLPNLQELRCIFHLQNTEPMISYEPTHFLKYQTRLKTFSIRQFCSDNTALHHILDLGKYPKSLTRLKLKNLKFPTIDKQIISPISHLNQLKSIKLHNDWSKDENLFIGFLKQLVPILSQVNIVEIKGISTNSFLKHIIDLPFNPITTLKINCHIPSADEPLFLCEPKSEFQRQLTLRLSSSAGKEWTTLQKVLTCFSHLEKLDLYVSDWYDDVKTDTIGGTFMLFTAIDNLPQLKDLKLKVNISSSFQTQTFKILDHFKKFFSRGIPIEGFQLSVGLLIDDQDVLQLYRNLTKYASSLKKLQLDYIMNDQLDASIIHEAINLCENLNNLEELHLSGLNINDSLSPRLLESILKMDRLKCVTLSEFFLLNELPHLVKTKKRLESMPKCEYVHFNVCTSNRLTILQNSEMQRDFYNKRYLPSFMF